MTARRLMREFKRGLSMIGLARKYGMPAQRVEDRLRTYARSATASAARSAPVRKGLGL